MGAFWSKLISSEAKDVSSKRIAGLYCILIYSMVLIVTFIIPLTMSTAQENLLNSLLYSGTLLLGVGIFDKTTKKE